jgi:hypothetical protein
LLVCCQAGVAPPALVPISAKQGRPAFAFILRRINKLSAIESLNWRKRYLRMEEDMLTAEDAAILERTGKLPCSLHRHDMDAL